MCVVDLVDRNHVLLGMIGTYIVVRFGVPTGSWPKPSMSMSKMGWGDQHVCAYLFQRIDCLGARCCQTQSRPDCLALGAGALLLGALFLDLRHTSIELVRTLACPFPPHSNIYDRADIHYVGAVTNACRSFLPDQFRHVRQNELVSKVE